MLLAYRYRCTECQRLVKPNKDGDVACICDEFKRGNADIERIVVCPICHKRVTVDRILAGKFVCTRCYLHALEEARRAGILGVIIDGRHKMLTSPVGLAELPPAEILDTRQHERPLDRIGDVFTIYTDEEGTHDSL